MTPSIDRREVEWLRSIIVERLGLQFGTDKLDELAAVVATRMQANHCASATAYAQQLATPEELRALADVLTIGETYFLRNGDQFRALREHVLPDRIQRAGSARRLRILSAGCSSGEEPYSVAIVLREILPELATWHIDIIGIDVNPSAIARARAGRYSHWSLRQTAEDFQQRYFQKVGQEYLLDPEIRAMVTFEERNLVDDDAAFFRAGSFDLVLCRNVTMYFAPDVTRRVIARFAESLTDGGYLFLGHAETLRGISNDFHLRHTHETFYYQVRGSIPPRPVELPAEIVEAEIVALTDPEIIDSSSWIETIRRASERIQALGSGQAAVAPIVVNTNVVAQALELLRQERFADALDALGNDSGDADTGLLRAVLLTNAGRLAEAEQVCAQLLASDELNASAHYVTALCREHAGNVASAVDHDQAAAYLDPTFAMPRLHLGLLAKKGGDRAAATRELAIALVLLEREDASRVLLLGGGFSRETLILLCRSELRALGGRT
jgi:chemotaxis protein methyltransferase CheR